MTTPLPRCPTVPLGSAMSRNGRLFVPVFALWLALDIVTKRLALTHLEPGRPEEVLGEVARLTLVFNRGAALGISAGEWSRVIFTAISLGMLFLLRHLYRTTRAGDRPRVVVLALITAGAIGNLIDRLRWDRGVVDFVDVGVGAVRFWTFNVADAGITVGAIALALLLGRKEEPAPQASPRPARSPTADASGRSPSDTPRDLRRS